MLDLAKVNRNRQLGQAQNQIDARANAMTNALARWLRRFANAEAERASRGRPLGKVFGKVTSSALLDDLKTLLARFGERQALDAAQNAARSVGVRIGDVSETFVGQAIEDRPIALAEFRRLREYRDLLIEMDARALEIIEDKQAKVDESVQRVLLDALRESPSPSTSEIARRVRRDIKGLPELSFERAHTIARTELGIAQNSGIVAGFKVSGIEEMEWLAFKFPIWPRRHDKMDGKKSPVGVPFTMPDGAKMRYPLDPLGPVGHIVNCRCTLAPVRRRRSRG